MDRVKELTEKIEALTKKADERLAAIESDDNASSEQVAEVKALINDEILPEINKTKEERAAALREEEAKALREKVTTLEETLEELKKPDNGFQIDSTKGMRVVNEPAPYEDGKSFYLDVLSATRKGNQKAIDRLTEGIETFEGKALTEEGKAMTEGTAAQGGYLVRPQLERTIVEAKELDNVLRGLCSKVNVTTNAIQIDQLGLTTSAGWVAELATKPESTAMSIATVTANVFTAAGLATISNQLLADSNPSVDSLVTADLVKRLVALEETAFLNGSGSGQPLGILNTPGLSTTTYNDASPTAPELASAVLDSIADVQTQWGQPTAILMHPRTWTYLIKDKDTYGFWTLEGTHANEVQGRTIFTGPNRTLWGVPVTLSNRMPTNLGGGTESRVIVGDFGEALILDRQGITVDESQHVYFTTNQTVFRVEERVGFTAARSPKAFNVVGGTGLAGV